MLARLGVFEECLAILDCVLMDLRDSTLLGMVTGRVRDKAIASQSRPIYFFQFPM